MARPRKNTVEYFPHQCDHGKTMFIIQKKYGNNGYAFWFKMLELLGKSEGHFLDLNDPADWEYLLSYAHMKDETCMEILNLLAKLEAIDAELWEEKIIWCQKFVDGISDVYANRRVETPAKPSFYRQKPTSAVVSTDENPQSKVKETKVKETIVNNNESAVFEFYGKHFPGAITPLMRDKICSYLDEMESGLIIYAMEKSALVGKKTFAYAGAILDSWLSNGIKTLEAAKAADEEYRKNKEQKKKTEVSPVGEAYKLYVPDFIPKEEPTPEGVAKIADLLKSTREKLTK